MSKFVKIDEVKHLEDKPDDIKYYLFNVDDPAIIEPFVKIEHKDHKQLYKENPSLIKPRYIYRKFNIDIPTLRKAYHEFIQSSIELNSALNDRKFSFAFKSGYASANAIILHIFYTFIIK